MLLSFVIRIYIKYIYFFFVFLCMLFFIGEVYLKYVSYKRAIHLNSPESTWIQLNPAEFTWIQLNSPESTWTHLNSPESSWDFFFFFFSFFFRIINNWILFKGIFQGRSGSKEYVPSTNKKIILNWFCRNIGNLLNLLYYKLIV